MINDLAGIQSDGPGYDQIIIAPHPPAPGSNPDHPPINWVKAHYDSIHGRIVSNWRRTKNNFELEVEIPANTTATVYVPAGNAGQVTESGRPLAHAAGVTFVKQEGGRAVLTIGSGTYRFVSHNL